MDENKKVSRFIARTIIILLCIGLAVILVGKAVEMPTVQYIGVGVVAIALFLKIFIFKCPYCGNHNILPQWSKSGTMKCSRCNHIIEYDK